MFLICITGPVTAHVPKVCADGGAPGNSVRISRSNQVTMIVYKKSNVIIWMVGVHEDGMQGEHGVTCSKWMLSMGSCFLSPIYAAIFSSCWFFHPNRSLFITLITHCMVCVFIWISICCCNYIVYQYMWSNLGKGTLSSKNWYRVGLKKVWAVVSLKKFSFLNCKI